MLQIKITFYISCKALSNKKNKRFIVTSQPAPYLKAPLDGAWGCEALFSCSYEEAREEQ